MRKPKRASGLTGPRKYRVITVRFNSRRKPRAQAHRFTTREALVAYLRKNPSGESQIHKIENQDLGGVELSGVDLARGSLKGTRLGRCNLDKANLDGADVTGAEFDSALMSRDQFSRTRGQPATMPEIFETRADRLIALRKKIRRTSQPVAI